MKKIELNEKWIDSQKESELSKFLQKVLILLVEIGILESFKSDSNKSTVNVNM